MPSPVRKSLIAFLLAISLLAPPWLTGAVAAADPCDPALGLACFDVRLSPATLIGDFYIDGNPIAGGVNSARLTGAANTPHVVEVRNIQDPATPGWNDLFLYPDQSKSNQQAGVGAIRAITFFPVKNYVRGTLQLTCNPKGRKSTDLIACRPTIDGATQPDVAPGAKASYNLPPGDHTVHTDLVGDQANNWSPTSRDDMVAIRAGRSTLQTTWLTASFALKGRIKIGLSPKGLLADLYVDGVLVASQSASAEAYVSPNVAHTVEARAVADPAANGLYVFGDASKSTAVSAASTRIVTLYPGKTWLYGFLKVTCSIRGKTAADDVQCVVSSDGAELGGVAAGKAATFNLPVGPHSISVATGGASAANWESPVSTTLNIAGGRTSYYTAGFKRKPAPAASATGGTPGVNHLGTEKVVIADYVMWYDPSNFDGSVTWDVPASGPYNSDDGSVIARHVSQAQQACLNGFAAHWYGPTDSRTTNNFNTLLGVSGGTALRHAIVIQANILPGASEQMIIDAINHVINQWAQGPNYLRLGGRPVIIFTDMPRPWGSDAAALAGWTRIRAATDPNHNTIWMAEGLYPTYNPLFDGLYAYRIDHRDYPESWRKQARWASGLRAVERRGNLPIGGLYFADTIAAGFDDTRSINARGDLRSDAPHFARDRRGGGYYTDTFNATANTGGDFLLVKSFNEWIEGTEIEPGNSYGNTYLDLTCQFANAYRSR